MRYDVELQKLIDPSLSARMTRHIELSSRARKDITAQQQLASDYAGAFNFRYIDTPGLERIREVWLHKKTIRQYHQELLKEAKNSIEDVVLRVPGKTIGSILDPSILTTANQESEAPVSIGALIDVLTDSILEYVFFSLILIPEIVPVSCKSSGGVVEIKYAINLNCTKVQEYIYALEWKEEKKQQLARRYFVTRIPITFNDETMCTVNYQDIITRNDTKRIDWMFPHFYGVFSELIRYYVNQWERLIKPYFLDELLNKSSKIVFDGIGPDKTRTPHRKSFRGPIINQLYLADTPEKREHAIETSQTLRTKRTRSKDIGSKMQKVVMELSTLLKPDVISDILNMQADIVFIETEDTETMRVVPASYRGAVQFKAMFGGESSLITGFQAKQTVDVAIEHLSARKLKSVCVINGAITY